MEIFMIENKYSFMCNTSVREYYYLFCPALFLHVPVIVKFSHWVFNAPNGQSFSVSKIEIPVIGKLERERFAQQIITDRKGRLAPALAPNLAEYVLNDHVIAWHSNESNDSISSHCHNGEPSQATFGSGRTNHRYRRRQVRGIL